MALRIYIHDTANFMGEGDFCFYLWTVYWLFFSPLLELMAWRRSWAGLTQDMTYAHNDFWLFKIPFLYSHLQAYIYIHILFNEGARNARAQYPFRLMVSFPAKHFCLIGLIPRLTNQVFPSTET